MNGSSVDVLYKGKMMRVFVYHGRKPSEEQLQDKAISTLERHEINYPSLSLDSIQKQMDCAAI